MHNKICAWILDSEKSKESIDFIITCVYNSVNWCYKIKLRRWKSSKRDLYPHGLIKRLLTDVTRSAIFFYKNKIVNTSVCYRTRKMKTFKLMEFKYLFIYFLKQNAMFGWNRCQRKYSIFTFFQSFYCF